jgi:hypothetical protein
MSRQDDIHAIAADFLQALKDGGSPFYQEEVLEVESLAVTNLVVLRMKAAPKYFYGFKASGAPVFTHDMKIAKTFVSSCPSLGQHADKLKDHGFEVEPHITVWREGALA